MPTRRVASAFGSVWDSQIGVPASRSASPRPVDDEDFDEPAVPEYLLTERRQRDAGRGANRGVRGGRGGAYAAALERERDRLAFGLAHAAVQPPSTLRAAPLISSAAGEVRKSATPAICSTFTNSLVGCAASSTSLMTCSRVMLRAFMVSGI